MDKLGARRLAAASAVVVGTLSVAQVALATNWAVNLQSGSTAQSQSATLTAPTSVTATCTSPTLKTIKVSWTAVLHASSYAIYQSSTSATTGYTAAASGVVGTSWTSSNLSVGKQYWFEVTVTIGTSWLSARSAATGSTTISNSSPNCSQP